MNILYFDILLFVFDMKCDLLVYLFVGYYCFFGSSVEIEIICSVVKYCFIGSVEFADCLVGIYVDYNGVVICIVCLEG